MNESDATRMLLTALVPYPCQGKIYTACRKADQDALAEDLRRHGQREDVHVLPPDNAAGLPPFTIIDGHSRVAALLAIGETEVNVLVRHDLKDADAAAVKAEYVRINLVRRQLHPLEKARAIVELFVTESGKTVSRLDDRKYQELHGLLGDALGCGRKNVGRYLRVLQTPMPVQLAVRDGRLNLELGARIAGLPAEQQEELAAEVAALPEKKKANELAGRYLQASPNNQRRVSDIVRNLAIQVHNAKLALRGRVDEVESYQKRRCRRYFQEGMKLLEQLMR